MAQKNLDLSIVKPSYTGQINLDQNSVSLVLALSVLHHIPNVAFTLTEIDRTLRSNGIVLIREPCSSMGKWGTSRGCTPNERGISREYLLNKANSLGWTLLRKPLPIHLEPLNKLIHKFNLYRPPSPFRNFAFLYMLDSFLSRAVSPNDKYWRQSFFSKIGPSSYFYIFSKG